MIAPFPPNLVFQQVIQPTFVIKMLAKTRDKFLARVGMTLWTAAFETVDCRQRADLATQLPIPAAAVAREESTAERIAYARGIDDLPLGYCRDAHFLAVGVEICAFLAAGNHNHFHMLQGCCNIPARLLRDQAELVVIAEQEISPLHVPGQFMTLEPQHLL